MFLGRPVTYNILGRWERSRSTPHPVSTASSVTPVGTEAEQIDVPELPMLMHTKKDVLSRFIHITRALGKVYALPPTSLHVFYDVAGSLIAFNAGGSLFCNLRYYEAWRTCIFSTRYWPDSKIEYQMTRMLRKATCPRHISPGEWFLEWCHIILLIAASGTLRSLTR
jgi:hypothetical protein